MEVKRSVSSRDREHENAEYFFHGRLDVLHNFVGMCLLMQEQLWDTGEKFQVTIDCDPRNDDFIMKREPRDS